MTSPADSRSETATDGSPNGREDDTLRNHTPAHELHGATFRRHGHHVVDPPPAAPVETREARREASRLGDVDAVLELPAAFTRADRTPPESENGLRGQVS